MQVRELLLELARFPRDMEVFIPGFTKGASKIEVVERTKVMVKKDLNRHHNDGEYEISKDPDEFGFKEGVLIQ